MRIFQQLLLDDVLGLDDHGALGVEEFGPVLLLALGGLLAENVLVVSEAAALTLLLHCLGLLLYRVLGHRTQHFGVDVDLGVVEAVLLIWVLQGAGEEVGGEEGVGRGGGRHCGGVIGGGGRFFGFWLGAILFLGLRLIVLGGRCKT